MKIINSYKSIQHYFDRKEFNRSVWKEYAADISAELPDKCIKDAKTYDYEGEILPIIQAVLSHPQKMELISESFDAVTRDLTLHLARLFDSEPDVRIILYLGLCNGAGWATKLENRDAILLGIEKIAELNWCEKESMQALIFHEVGHIWHKYIRGTKSDDYPINSSILQLYQEGIAMICEQILCNDSNYYHQNKNSWLHWCRENEENLKQEYYKRVSERADTQVFFGDWCSYQGHSDVGYYLGCQFIRFLQKKYSLIEAAALPNFVLEDEFRQFAV